MSRTVAEFAALRRERKVLSTVQAYTGTEAYGPGEVVFNG